MSGLSGQLLSYLARRGLESMPSAGMLRARSDAGHPAQPPEFTAQQVLFFVGIGVIVITTVLIVASVDYTVGTLMASLAMVESPSTTAIITSKPPPAYSEEPDAPLEKEPLIDSSDADVEVVAISHTPITAKIRSTIKHLHNVGGFWARWRGARQNIVYGFVLHLVGNVLGSLFRHPFGPMSSHFIGFTLATVGLCRLHMMATHAMIATQANAPWYRLVPRKQCKSLLLPSLVYAVAQQLAVIAPMFVATQVGLPPLMGPRMHEVLKQMSRQDLALTILRALAIPASAVLVLVTVLLPAATTLARVEASLLPEDRETIVPFDEDAIIGGIDLGQRGSAKKVFSKAWTSYDSSVRSRLVKLFVKLFFFQFAVIFVGMHLAVGLALLSNQDLKETYDSITRL